MKPAEATRTARLRHPPSNRRPMPPQSIRRVLQSPANTSRTSCRKKKTYYLERGDPDWHGFPLLGAPLKNERVLANIGFNTAEKEPSYIWHMRQFFAEQMHFRSEAKCFFPARNAFRGARTGAGPRFTSGKLYRARSRLAGWLADRIILENRRYRRLRKGK